MDLRAALRILLPATAALGLAGCATRAPLPLRPEPIAWADTLPIPEPEAREAREVRRLLHAALGEELIRGISLRRWTGNRREALNVTHFDDVVSSAWFEHRNGRRAMPPAEIRRGPMTVPGPDTSRTLTVVDGKAEGISPGFTVRDARGHTWLFKLDPRGHLHLASAAGVISNRLFHAAGYHVPEDAIVVFRADRLEVEPDATIEGDDLEPRPMSRDDLDRILALTDTLGDGRYLALASRFVPGTPKGPFLFGGRREDDPNDHYLHEARRELRGLYVVSSWLNHVDVRFANTLDAYVAPGYLRHYLIDFAASLGSGTIRPHTPREGREYNFDLWPSLARLVTLGIYARGWEDEKARVIHPALGWMPVGGYDPGSWRPNWPNPAFNSMTLRDAYWGAKLVASFTDEQIRAAIEAGGLPSTVAADTLADILSFRRDRAVAHWFSRVTPIEDPRVEARPATTEPMPAGQGARRERADHAAADEAPGPGGGRGADGVLRLTARDLALECGLREPGEARYAYRFRHEARGIELQGTAADGAGGAVLDLALPAPARDPEGLSDRGRLARIELAVARGGERSRPATIHLYWEEGAAGYRVVGLEH